MAKKTLLSVMLSAISAYSLCVNSYNYYEIFFGTKQPYNLVLTLKYFIYFFVLCILYYFLLTKIKPKLYKSVSIIITVIASYASISYPYLGTMFPMYSHRILLNNCLYFVGRFFTYYLVLEIFVIIFSFLRSNNKVKLRLDNKKLYILSFIVIFICWLPYIVLRYPAGIESDASNQLSMYFGAQELTNRWPVFVCWFTGTIISIGRTITGSAENGILVYVIIQAFFSIGVLCYSAIYIRKKTGNDLFCLILLFIYAFVPLFPSYSTSILKDTPFSILVLLLVILLDIEFSNATTKNSMLIFLCSLFMCLFRNNGIYIVYFLIVFMIILMHKNIGKIKNALVSLFFCALLYIVFCNALLPWLNIKSEITAEALSIPFQQTARYINLYPDDVTEEEREAISSILDYEIIQEEYNPLLSDPVKVTYRNDASGSELANYFKTWFGMFLKRPLLYVDSTANNIYGFFDINSSMWNRLNCAFYTHCIIGGLGDFTIPLKEYADIFEDNYLTFLESNIITRWLCHCAVYNLIGIFIFIYLLSHKKKIEFIIFLPAAVTILILFASPTYVQNGLRYALPVVYTIPFFVCLFFSKNNNALEILNNKVDKVKGDYNV